ncbi:MAG: alpha/beta hydrolase [Helicobacteraceae bacterium]|jgi:pimeloyl-ACP methyl ester carboxylesterase|nr:alpha/beta hydrolase [Helicobacteraceae bacterium]
MAIRAFRTPLGVYEISYLLEGDANAPKIAILHGWGANKELMKNAFSRYLGDFRALYIDLPGFGASKNDRVLTSADYAVILGAVFAELDFSPQTIAAHSFGGKIAALLDPPLLVLLSSAGVPKPKSLYIRLKIALAKRFKRVGANSLRDRLRAKDAIGVSENMYETFKLVVDEDFTGEFAKRDKPTLIFWGESDRATPLKSGETIRDLIKDAVFTSFEGDHFFFISRAETIADKIRTFWQIGVKS